MTGPIDAIEIDPFRSPYRPQSGAGGGVMTAPPPADAAAATTPREEPVVACETGPSDFKSQVARFERDLLANSLAEHRFNQRQTAEALGLSYDQLRHALRRHDLIGTVA